MIQKVIDAMQAGDYVALSECFAPNGRLFDYCPVSKGSSVRSYHVCNFFVYGRQAIEMFFHNKFYFHTISISDPVINDDLSADYFVSYGGEYVYARAQIESLSEDGLIQDLVVRLA